MIEETSPFPRKNKVIVGRVIIGLVILTGFLPYFPFGFRAEHILAPMVACVAFIFFWKDSTSVSRRLLVLVACLAAGITSSILASLISSKTGTQASALNMFIRLAMPPTLLVAFTYIIVRSNISFEELVRAIFASSVFLAMVSIVSIYAVHEEVFYPFVVEGGVWTASRDIGRYPGIFNQPLEAGLYFGFSTICVAYIYQKLQMNKPALISGAFIILVGGSVSLSKTFILGLALSMLLLALFKRWKALCISGVTSILVIGGALTILNPSGSYVNSLRELFVSGGLIAAASAGRFGVEGAGGDEMAGQLASAAVSSWENLVIGFGLGSFMPLDSGFLEYAYQGGLVGLVGYLSFFSFFAWIFLRDFRSTAGAMILFICLFSLMASIGGPALTANRAGYVLILFFAGALVESSRRFPAKASYA